MTIKGKDFKKAVAFIKEFLHKMPEDTDCAQLRDSLNLSLIYMKKYFRTVWLRTQETKNNDANILSSLSLARGISPTGPHAQQHETLDRFSWRWVSVDNDVKLLRGSLPVDGGRNLGRVPLILQATKEGDKELIGQLIEKEPLCVNAVDALDRTAAMYAVHFGEQECLEVLIQGEADLSHQAIDGTTALHVAIHDGNYEAMELLLKHDKTAAAPNSQDTQGRAPVHWATVLPDTQCLQSLLKCNIDVNIRDRDGLTPAMWACHMDNQKHFDLLTSSPGNKISENDGIERDLVGRTWIHWAVRRSGPLKCLRNLLTAETASIKDNEGQSVIHVSAQIGALEACKVIVSQVGAHCLNDVDTQNRTCLHLAAMAAHGEVLNYLLEQGTDINIRDSSNLTAWDYSNSRNLHYCMMVIRSFHKQFEPRDSLSRQQRTRQPEEEKLEDIEENNNCAILPPFSQGTPTPSTSQSINPTSHQINDKLMGVPTPPNQPKPLFQNIPPPTRARSPRPLSPKMPLSSPLQPPAEDMVESVPQDVQDSPGDRSKASPLQETGSKDENAEEISHNVDPYHSSDLQYTHNTESGDLVHTAVDGVISSDMQPSHQTNNGDTQEGEAEIPDGGFENRQRSISLGSDDVSEQSINIGMDVSDIEGEGQSNGDSTAEDRPVEPSSPKQMTSPRLTKPKALLPGRAASPMAAAPIRPASPMMSPSAPSPARPASPGPPMINQTGQMQNNHSDSSAGSRQNSIPSPQPSGPQSPRRLIPLGGGGNLVTQSIRGEDISKEGGGGTKGKKKKKKKMGSIGGASSHGDGTLQPIAQMKSPTSPLQPVHGAHHLMRPPSPKNNLQPPSSPSGRSKSPISDRSVSPRPTSSRGSSPLPSSGSSTGLPPPAAQGKNTWEVTWAPKQPKVPSTPITPREQRSASSPLLSPSMPPTQPQEGSEGQQSPRDNNKGKQNVKSQGDRKGVLKPQPFQGRPLAPMKPGGSFPNQQRPLAPKISQPPRQNASQSYTKPLNPAPPRNKGRPGGYSI